MQWLGLTLGSFFLIFSFSQVNWNEFTVAIKNVEIKWILAMAIALFTSMFLRSIRWQVIAALPLRDTAKVWQASCVGYLGSAIYPAKAGEVLKIIKIQQLTCLKSSEAIISSLFDRVLDIVALLVLCILLGTQSAHFNLLPSIQIILICFSLAFLIMLLYKLAASRIAIFFESLASKNKFGKWLQNVYEQSLTGMYLLKAKRLILPCLLLQIFITFLDVFACWLLFCAFGWKDLSLIPAVTMLICLATAFCLPSTPGYIGVYQIAAIFALAFFDINESQAVAYGTLFQTIAFLLSVGVGVQSHFNQFILRRLIKQNKSLI